jgi:predicted transcriptional regulator
MSRVVSFRASEQLDEYLQEIAKERMTTKSTVANMLVAERVRQMQEEEGESGDESESGGEVSEAEQEDMGEVAESGKETGGLREIFDRHSDKWYRPNTQENHKFAVRMPDSAGADVKYYQTEQGAANRLDEEYE